ncbi:hypothetical protein VTO73DRAFT_13470 [Trametes versicolor]
MDTRVSDIECKSPEDGERTAVRMTQTTEVLAKSSDHTALRATAWRRSSSPRVVREIWPVPEAIHGEFSIANPKRHLRLFAAVDSAPPFQKVFASGVQDGPRVVADLPMTLRRIAADSDTRTQS